ncbi:MAG: hypothetical protein V4474_00995 [Patescibacteria group bacterium]
MRKKSAVEKSIERHKVKAALRAKQKAKTGGDTGVPHGWGWGMGWPERKDFATEAEYVAYRRKMDPHYAPGHDGRLYAIV